MTNLQSKLTRLNAQLSITKGRQNQRKLIEKILKVEAAIEAIEKNTIISYQLSVNSQTHMRTNQIIEIEMIKIPAAKYKIGKYPVTQAQYKAVMGTNPSYFKNDSQNPVEQVSWNDAQAFCEKLSEITGENYRLPTESEWEYACCAGTTTNYYFGDNDNQLGNYAWYGENSQNKTHPVAQKLPNDWGLYDMHGNIWEWTDKARLRGGSCDDLPLYCRSAFCIPSLRRDFLLNNIGFRVVCDN